MSTVVWHGWNCNLSPYNVVQHQYTPLDYKNHPQGGYAELLEIVDGPQDKRIIVHFFLNSEGSSYFVYDSLELSEIGYKHCLSSVFVRSRDLWLPGKLLSWDYVGYNLPWFYAETKEGVK